MATATPGVYQVEGRHLYAEGGTYTIQVSASDTGGSSVGLTSTASATVTDLPLTAGALTPPVAIEGKPLSNVTVFHFTDAIHRPQLLNTRPL